MQNILKIEESRLMEESFAWVHSESDKGQIYTRPEIVEFMLTAIGLNSNEDFKNARILEPSCGEGEFVIGIVKRLLSIAKRKPTTKQLMNKILAVDLVSSSVEVAKVKVGKLLSESGYTPSDIQRLLENWFLSADFLLEDIEPNFSHIIGNPPYVRVENIPKGLLLEYRRRFSTMKDRADLYIPFFEKSLSVLGNGGKLSFICTDRWTKNTYGRSLRSFISDNYALELFIDLYDVDAFEQDVMTYPAITQIVKGSCDKVVLVHDLSFSEVSALEVLDAINGKKTSLQIRKGIVQNEKPWLLGSSDQMELISALENRFPALEEVNCKVFIGAATGSNKIYIVDDNHVDTQIEETRLLPVITANELKAGEINWSGKFLVNTYESTGVIDLDNYPKLSKYLNKHKDQLCMRHVAKKDTEKWFKTIDRVYEERAEMEKLLIPDISNDPIVLYDEGRYHPNNSIYYICSNDWNLHALRVVLLSNVTKMFISAYSTKIAKGYLRFQAQHLRKIRVPKWGDVSPELQTRLVSAGTNDDTEIFTALTCEMYGLNNKEKSIVGI